MSSRQACPTGKWDKRRPRRLQYKRIEVISTL